MSRNAPSAEDAENALCDLNTAYAIIALCEGGLFRTPSGHRFADRIVRQCKDHAQKQLNAYDRAKRMGAP